MTPVLVIKHHSAPQDYQATWQAMRTFTTQRSSDTADELWVLQHPPVYTLGLAGKKEHLLVCNEIPVIHSDRGGQITYHGPGQLVVYTLLDLERRRLGVAPLVRLLEESLIRLLTDWGLRGERVRGAPGVYVEGKKIAALGLRIRRGCCYHGLALNVDLDLSPYDGINPCGYPDLRVTSLARCGVLVDWPGLTDRLLAHLDEQLNSGDHP